MKEFLDDILEIGVPMENVKLILQYEIFGKVDAWSWVIEFQQRGLYLFFFLKIMSEISLFETSFAFVGDIELRLEVEER